MYRMSALVRLRRATAQAVFGNEGELKRPPFVLYESIDTSLTLFFTLFYI